MGAFLESRSRSEASAAVADKRADLVRGLSMWDGVLLTIGSILGTGIFITTGDMARALPHEGLILIAWALGGLLTLGGALTYAELGAMYPRSGGQYQYLKEAYGPVWGFLFGWTAFFIIMAGGIAAIAVGFGTYLGSFAPFFSSENALFALPLGSRTWTVHGGQLAAVLAIALLSFANYVGLRSGAFVQNAVTLVKVGSIVGLAVIGLIVPAAASLDPSSALPSGSGLASALGVAMIAVVWSYDGWYAVTNVAGEMRSPERNLPRAIGIGTAAVTVLYILMNLVYMRALTVSEMAGTGRVAEVAAQTLFGAFGARVVSAAVLVSSFGCISATILYAARIYLPMAEDGVFFSALARIHPRYRVPAQCILWQGIWAIALVLTGSYEALYTYVTFAVVLFHAATGAAVFVLRRTRPEAERPYRAWGYPVVPALFVLASLAICANTLLEKPTQSLIGLFIVVLGLPAYALWRRRASAP
jgi:APA family basic amino acid/polyamine antiporter